MLQSEIQSLVQIASMYYKEHLNQQDIADRMGITRQTVIKMLKKAEVEGIVEFKIHNPLEVLEEYSSRLAERFNLRKAIVVPCKFKDQDMVTAALSQHGSKYILDLLDSGLKNVGLSWGRSVYRTIVNLPVAYYDDVNFFPLVGASSRTAEYFMINEIVRKAATTLNATPIYTYIPADPGSLEDINLFKRTSAYDTIANCWKNIDLAVMGVGVNPSLEQGIRDSYPGEQFTDNIAFKDAAGDMLTHYFDANGQFITINEEHILCAGIDDLKNAKRVLAIAGGVNKAAPIFAALKTGIITDIVTDQNTCERLLKMRG